MNATNQTVSDYKKELATKIQALLNKDNRGEITAATIVYLLQNESL